MTSTIVPVFVDTNVLVYARDATEGEKQAHAWGWLDHLWRTRDGRLSDQVLQEFYVTVTRKLRPGLSAAEARADVRALLAWRPATVDRRLLENAWQAEERDQLSFWDALIVAAASFAGCERLLSEDLTDGRSYGDVEVVNPFLHTPPR